MRMTIPGKDVIVVNDDNLDVCVKPEYEERAHIVKLSFKQPTNDKINKAIRTYSNTNRFIIDNNVKFYNSIFKKVGKKYYVQNEDGSNFVSFVRRNNKILVDFTRMTQTEKRFLMDNYLGDILRNCEVILVEENDLDTYSNQLKGWNGNVIIKDVNYQI